MKSLKKLACAAAMAFSCAGAAHADVLNNWVFHPTGGGFAAGQQINEYLDFNGNAFVQLTPTGATSFSFTEHAVFNVLQADSNGKFFPLTYPGGNISATFIGNGTGTLGGNFRFDGGTIRMYQNPVGGQYASANGIYGANLGNEIAVFDVMAGVGGVANTWAVGEWRPSPDAGSVGDRILRVQCGNGSERAGPASAALTARGKRSHIRSRCSPA